MSLDQFLGDDYTDTLIEITMKDGSTKQAEMCGVGFTRQLGRPSKYITVFADETIQNIPSDDIVSISVVRLTLGG